MKLNTLFTLFLFAAGFFSSPLIGQTALSDAPRRADLEPAWPGCDPKMTECTKNRLLDFIASNLQIPPQAKAENAGGVVVMEFVIEKNGLIGEIHPMHDPGLGLGEEATRVIELMKSRKMKWIPAENDGKRIPFRYITPVSFNLPTPPKEVTDTAPVKDGPADGIYDVVDEMPRYAGCNSVSPDSADCSFRKMLGFIRSNLVYPEEAKTLKVHGQVVVQFVISETGNVSRAELIQGIGAGCDAEALRVVSAMPAWTPGKQAGQAVPVRMKLPIYFQLPKEKEPEEAPKEQIKED